MKNVSAFDDLNKKNIGFTLIELIVSIVILGILASIVVLSYPGIKKQMTIVQMNSDLKTASMQLARDFSKDGKFPNMKEDSGGGKGLIATNGNSFNYIYYKKTNTFCLASMNGTLIYHISSTDKTITTGDCPIDFYWTVLSSGGGGTDYSCAIASDGKAYCWGYNYNGQLGNNSTTSSSIPVAVSQGAMPAGAVKQLVVGAYHTCAIASDNKAYCWGGNDSGQLGNNSTASSSSPVAVSQGVMPAGAVKQLVAGYEHTCLIASDDKVYCWGGNGGGQLGNNSKASSSIPVAVSQGVMPAGAVKQLTAGAYHTCAVASDDKVYCWGRNSVGQLGNNSTTSSSIPVAVSQGAMPAGAIKQLTAGDSHACAIASDDKAYCWGGNNYGGQLGNNSLINSSIPVMVSQGGMTVSTVKQLTAGYYHTCAVTSDDKAYCWGYNSFGQLGNNATTSSSIPVMVSQGAMPAGEIIKQLDGGSNHTCAITSDNNAYCWGANFKGQLGLGYEHSFLIPTASYQGAMPAGAVKKLWIGYSHTCVIASDDNAYCWGNNSSGQLGNNSTIFSTIPVVTSQGAMPAGAIKQLAVGSSHTCAVASDGKAYCWGDNDSGQLGINVSYDKESIPVAVFQGAMPAGAIKQLVSKNQHSCAIASDDKVYCWGSGNYGQLGNNSTASKYTPVAVSQGAMPAGAVKQLWIGSYHTCAIASDNKVYCWGGNSYGQLGDNSKSDRSTPVAVSQGAMPVGEIKQLSGGYYHTCAIASDDKAYCWGYNSNGQLGNNSKTNSTIPVAVSQGAMPAGAVKQLAAGDWHTCAIASDDKAYCWGYNSNGQLGNNSKTNSTIPIAVSQGAIPTGTIKQLAASSEHVCAIASDNKVYCWGKNDYGQLGLTPRSYLGFATPFQVIQPNL